MTVYYYHWDMTSRHNIESSDAYIVHQRPYKETSTIIDAFTEQHGRMSYVVKGSKNHKVKNNKWQILQPFNQLKLSWLGKGDLKTLTACEAQAIPQRLLGVALYSGLYVNELIYHCLKPNDASPMLFIDYQHCIAGLNNGVIEPSLRQFEIQLLQELGYGIDFQYQADGNFLIEEQSYRYHLQQGFIPSQTADAVKGSQLLAIAARAWDNKSVLADAKKILRPLIHQLLNGKTLKSRQYFIKPC